MQGQTTDEAPTPSLLTEPHGGPTHPPEIFCRVIDHLMSPSDATNEGPDRPNALRQLNEVLAREDFEAFYGEDKHCYLRQVGTNTVTVLAANPHRPLTAAEAKRRQELASYLDACSEDELIEEVLLPLFRQLGFHRITAAGHKDKALEYGKDVWMRYTLPTQHFRPHPHGTHFSDGIDFDFSSSHLTATIALQWT